MRALLLLATCGALLGGCLGDSPAQPPRAAEPPAATQAPLEGSAPELARLQREAGLLLEGGPAAFERRLRELRGHPVVVNKWASWCGPCREEFPVFRRVARELGREVAFVGVNSLDNDDSARRFLAANPVGYPSFRDPEHEVAKLFRGNTDFPTTAFYDARGGSRSPSSSPTALRRSCERTSSATRDERAVRGRRA